MKNTYSFVGYGGVGSTTGANFLLECPNTKILVDCGLFQGSEFAMEENRIDFPYNPSSIDFLLITHAHIDHIGRIPKLVKDGFKGVIYSTPETKELSALMLDDAQTLLAREASESNLVPLYEKSDIANALNIWKTVSYHQNLELAPNISINMKDAGHILGSAIIEITFHEIKKKIAFTGDLGNSPTPLLRDTEYVTDTDYIVMESVYGDRNHEPKDERDRKFKSVILETIKRGGTVVIPAFSLERTQVILYQINNLIESGEIPKVPVFLDSPLAIRVTEVYKNHTDSFSEKIKQEIASGDDIFDFPGFNIVGRHGESEGIDKISGSKIIIAGSGMSVGGRVLHHEKTFLSDPKSTILLVGYQVPGSLGRQIEEKVSRIIIDGAYVKVKAHIEKISGYSSHKDSNNLVEFISHSLPKIKQVFVAMGENRSSSFLVQRLRSELGVNSTIPEIGKKYLL